MTGNTNYKFLTFEEFKNEYTSNNIRKIKGVYVYEGFVFKPSIPYNGDDIGVLYASYIHDLEYTLYHNRLDSDRRLFVNLRKHSKLSIIECNLAYIVVRLFGWIYWYDLNNILKKIKKYI